MSKQTHNFPAS